MTKYFFHIVLLSAMFVSCAEKHDKELNEISGLRSKLDKSDSLLRNVDLKEAQRLLTEVTNNARFIQFNLNLVGDTIDYKTSRFVNRYQSLLGALQTVTETHDAASAAADSTRKSLSNLEHDLENNSLAKGLTPEGCIENEEEQVNSIYEQASRLRSILDEAKAGYDTLAPKITAYMNSLSQQVALKQQSK